MSQISMPIRIVLVGAIVFMAAWFTVLKPGAGEEVISDPGAAVSSKAGEFADKAEAGAATAERDAQGAANATLEDNTAAPNAAVAPSTTGTTAGTATTTTQPGTQPAPLTGKAAEKLPAPIRDALEERKVLVLGVLNPASETWAPMADDDRAVRDALKGVNRYDGEVKVHTAPVDRLARYEGLLNALAVSQTPTVVIVDRARQATALTGYFDRTSVNQAIVDARRASTDTLIKDKFLAKVNRECARGSLRFTRAPRASRPSEVGAHAARFARISRLYAGRVARISAPARWRPLRGQMIAAFRAYAGYARQVAAATGTAQRRLARKPPAALLARDAALDRRLNAVGLTSCTSVNTA